MASLNFANDTNWTGTVDRAGTYTIPVKDKYLSKDIVVTVPSAAGSIEITKESGSINGTNCVLSSTDTSGISISDTGAVSAKANVSMAGYVDNGEFVSGTLDSSATAAQYITEVTLSNNKTFKINDSVVENGWTFSLDASGNVTIF